MSCCCCDIAYCGLGITKAHYQQGSRTTASSTFPTVNEQLVELKYAASHDPVAA